MKKTGWLLVVIWLCVTMPVEAQERGCRPVDEGVEVTAGGQVRVVQTAATALDCLVEGERLFVALGPRGLAVYDLGGDAAAPAATWTPVGGEVVRLEGGAGGVTAVTARLEVVPLTVAADGSVRPRTLSAFLEPRPAAGRQETVTAPSAPAPASPVYREPQALVGKVQEVQPEHAVLDVGVDDGVEEGDRFEIRSQEMAKQYNLTTGREELMPSDRITAVAKVVRVIGNKSLVKLGRGDRARVGDRAVRTSRTLTHTRWFPGYERNLNRIQARVAPFLGVETLTGGLFTRALYDRTFSFPLRVEAGLRNVGFLFGENFAAPMQLDLIPSYDTEYFEVGLGGGYSYSSHEKKRGFTFLQKIRLGTVDGVSFTMWNSFIYQEKHDEYLDETGAEFEWNGFDAALAFPLTDRVTLATEWSYSQAGWLFGDIGIRTLVTGNGGDGTLIIPVSIGGGVVIDYEREDNSWSGETYWDDTWYGGPVVSIGLDYRWR